VVSVANSAHGCWVEGYCVGIVGEIGSLASEASDEVYGAVGNGGEEGRGPSLGWGGGVVSGCRIIHIGGE
jgi:hypothetical protein